MRTVELQIIYTLGEMGGLPVGTRIATNHNKLLVLEEWIKGHRTYWMEEGELTPYSPLVHWLPVIVLPPVVDHAMDDAKRNVHDILGGESLAGKPANWKP